jgi:PAS domain S-box-containing protein
MNRAELQDAGLLELILNSLGEGVIVADVRGRILLFNPTAEKITGQTAEDLPYERWTDAYGIFRPDGVTPIPTDEIPLVRAIRGESSDEVELFMRNSRIPDGIYLRSTGRPIRNDKGELIGGVVVFRDISQEVRSIHKFKGEASRVLYELAKVYDPDRDSQLRRITEAGAKTLRVERVSLWLFNDSHTEILCENLYHLGRGCHNGGDRLTARRYPAYFEALEESRLIDAADARHDPRTSEYAKSYLEPLDIVSMMDVPVRLHGKVVGIICHEHVGSVRHWTAVEQEFATSLADLASLALEADERMKIEKESEKNLSLLRATLESTADGILVVDRAGKMVSYNRKFVEMWGIPADILSTGDDDRALAFVVEQLKEPESFLAKVRDLYAQPDAEVFDVLEFKDGRVFERYSKPQRLGGESVGRVWSFRDVTDRRRAEEELRIAYERLKKLDQIKTNFASMISHELKTPLAAIQESVNIVLDGIDGPVQPAQRRTLDIAKLNAEWLARLVGNFLTFTKIESGRMDLRLSSLDARTIIEDACRLMKPLAEKKGLQCFKFLPNEAVPVRWDADKIKTVVLNLFDNAVKFTEAPGSVRVRLQCAGQEAIIEVEDTGVGVLDEDRDLIFDMFAQAATRPPWQTGGFGIGLSICKRLAESHGGTLSLERPGGRGSRFVVRLPLECSR